MTFFTRTFLWVLVGVLCSTGAYAEQEFFPFLATINQDHVNVRAGQNQNFETVCRLGKGDKVVVLGRNYSWYKIRLPQKAQSYIFSEYVQTLPDGQGEVTGSKVNIRAGAGSAFTALGHVGKGDRVRILGLEQGWYKILPVENAVGWISEDLLVFASKDIAQYREPVFEETAVVVAQPVAEAVSSTTAIQARGEIALEKNSGTEQYVLRYEQGSYYLAGLEQSLLGRFLHYIVNVEGDLISTGDLPTVSVSKIQIAL